MTQPIDESELDWGFDAERLIRCRNFTTDQIHDFRTSEEVATLLQLDATEIEWAIEEYGRCDTATWVCWQPTDNNGTEWPVFEAPSIENLTPQATPEQLKQAAAWGEKFTALLDEAEQEDIDFRLIRAIMKDSMDRINETIHERQAKDKR